jgi:AcrR family transcriptional regulator
MNATAAARPATSKGEETRAQILAAAVQMASEGGFESITIGALAERTGLSKSGLFAHFGSRTELQIAALDEAARVFTETVFLPALKAPRGVKRLRALFDHWLGWTDKVNLAGGCPLDAAGREYDHRAGPMQDAVKLKADTDVPQVTFEFVAIVMAFYRAQLTFGKEAAVKRARVAFDRLISQAHA